MGRTHAQQDPSAVPGRRERRRAETREKLFRAAMRLFAEQGFFETTTEDITEAADVGQGTFCNYFPTAYTR
jgi:AcrR family transcriptional regulator